MGLHDTKEAVTSDIPSRCCTQLQRSRAHHAPLRGGDVLEHPVGPPIGANQTTTIDDLSTTAIAVGTGKLLSTAELRGDDRTGPARLRTRAGGLRADLLRAERVLQLRARRGARRRLDPAGPAAVGARRVEAYLPSEKIGIALATTLDPGAFTPEGAYKNAAGALFKQIGAIMAPDDAPPVRPAP